MSVSHPVRPAKAAKAMEMPFALRTRVGLRNHVGLLDVAERFQPSTCFTNPSPVVSLLPPGPFTRTIARTVSS